MVLKLFGQTPVRKVVFGGYYKTGGVHIYSVNYARAYFSVYAGKGSAAVKQQGVYKSGVGMAGCGVDNHTPRLVYNYNIAVFIYNVKRDILRQNLQRFRLRYVDIVAAPLDSFVVFLYALAERPDKAALNKLLSSGTGKTVDAFGYKAVKAYTAGAGFYGNCHFSSSLSVFFAFSSFTASIR